MSAARPTPRGPVRRAVALSGAFVGLVALSACASPPRTDDDAPDPMLRSLRLFEASLRADTSQPKADLGPDPYVLAVSEGKLFGALRGASSVVLLDEELHEVARASTGPCGAEAIVASPRGGGVFVGGPGCVTEVHVEPGGRGLRVERASRMGALHARALAAHRSGALYAVDPEDDALRVFFPSAARGERADAPREPLRLSVPAGPFRVVATERHLVVASLVGHALSVFELASDGAPVGPPETLRHDGPFWGIAARERAVGGETALEIAAGGVEDHPLDRAGGSFGYVDSFVYLYRDTKEGLREVRATHVGELGVVTPKALAFLSSGALRVVGYGSDALIDVEGGFDGGAPKITKRPSVAGVASMIELAPGVVAAADPLLDAWLLSSPEGWTRVPVPAPPSARTTASRIGEALVFTTLISPWAKTDAELSRFTCETCHFEGISDGRTHFTGRGAVHATTKPLYGLFVNEPHFARALDEDMAKMITAEFRVASANTGHSPIFGGDEVRGSPALPGGLASVLGEVPEDVDTSPLGLRKALMEFLRDFAPQKNPRTVGRTEFTREERRGAEVFRDRCVSCHAARLIANDAHTEIPFEDWEREIFGDDRIVWARDGRERTGIEPLVHEEGARPTSLRRVGSKRPYFTNGSSPTLVDALLRVALRGGAVLHEGAGAHLDDEEVRALVAFLELL